MTKALEGMGWTYLILSTIASIIIWANSNVEVYSKLLEKYITETSTIIIAYGFAILIQGIMVHIVFIALAEILKKLDG